jgi:hypothetical protein
MTQSTNELAPPQFHSTASTLAVTLELDRDLQVHALLGCKLGDLFNSIREDDWVQRFSNTYRVNSK